MSDLAMHRTGWALTGLFAAFMLFDAGIKLIDHPMVRKSMAELEFPTHLGFTIGLVEAACLLLFLVPRTAPLGAILFMAIFGGAIATHMRMESPLFSHTLFGVYLGLLMWGGLWLRDPALRALFPLRQP